jgi:DNA replication protein DnaC
MMQKEELWKQLKENVKALKQPKNIILLGPKGVGKSSFINSAIATLTGKYNYYAIPGSGSNDITTCFHKYAHLVLSTKDSNVLLLIFIVILYKEKPTE